MDSGAGIAILCGAIVLVVWSMCACSRRDDAQQQNGRPQTGETDGNMVVLDGLQLAETVVQVQPGCCCGGGGDGDGDGDGNGDGNGGGCGGCGGD